MARFRNPITLQGVESGDGRIFNLFEFNDMPLPARWAPADHGGHDGAVAIGVLEEAHVATDAEKAEFGYTGAGELWIGSGSTLDSPVAQQAEQLMAGGAAFWSVDPGGALDYRYVIVDGNGNEVDPKEVSRAYDKVYYGEDDDGEAQQWLETLRERIEFDLYTVGGITLLDIPCFPEARAALVAEGDQRAAATGVDRTDAATRSARRMMRRLAAGPATRPAAWFAQATYDRYTPWSITDEGEFIGHLAGWNACHRSHLHSCEKPDYQTSFDEFHTGWVALDSGERLRVGVVTHVEGHLNTAAEYDRVASDPACQIGCVHLYADRWGIQIRGGVHPDVTPAQIARALASAPSGDWRGPAGGRKLYGVALVNTPGYTAYVADDGQGVQRMVASIPPPLPENLEPPVTQLFFDAAPSVVTAACACQATPAEQAAADEHTDCGCGGEAGHCTCDGPTLSAQDLLDLARLDEAHKLQASSA